jgi:16S rRNA (cytosine967-C5)-methyltransferase
MSEHQPVKLYRNLSEAVVDNLQQIFDDHRYADKVIEKVLKQNPKWGARDRRFIAETTYDIVRWYRLYQVITQAAAHEYWKLLGAWCIINRVPLPPWTEFQPLRTGDVLKAYEGVKQNRVVAESVPDWLDALGQRELGDAWASELHALNEPAKVVLRVNTLKTTRHALQRSLLQNDRISTEAPAEFPDALILAQRQNIFTRPQFRDGLFEVQDAGSQLIAPYLQIQPGMRIIDACAGGGGKTLHLASLSQNKGRIVAMDTEPRKLDELKKRARRAGANNIETRIIESSKTIKRLEGSADRLLLDVPCSGTGVIKRNPDAKWKLSQAFFNDVKALQQKILHDYSIMLKPGGIMVYSTCSLFPSENEQQVQDFLQQKTGQFELLAQHTILPGSGYDGFYMARLRRAN